MSRYYYLISSLSMLEFGSGPFISYDDFLRKCSEQLNMSDMEALRRAGLGPFENTEDGVLILRKWKIFDTHLRNEIARNRAIKHGKNPDIYIRGDNYIDPFVSGFAHFAVNQNSPKEAESYLDKIRWEKIEELGKGHYFDIEYLITYALKLLILERWNNINKEGGMQELKTLIAV